MCSCLGAHFGAATGRGDVPSKCLRSQVSLAWYALLLPLPLRSLCVHPSPRHFVTRPFSLLAWPFHNFQFVIAISVFYGGEQYSCGTYCEQANCINFVPDLCTFDLHEEL